MLVMLDEPKNEKWGSEAAAPIFAAIGREALRYMNVPSRDTTPVPIVRGEGAPAAMAATLSGRGAGAIAVRPASLEVDAEPVAVMPAVEGLALRQAMETLAPFNVALEISGRGVVRSQSPAAGVPLMPGTLCRLTLASPIARPGGSP